MKGLPDHGDGAAAVRRDGGVDGVAVLVQLDGQVGGGKVGIGLDAEHHRVAVDQIEQAAVDAGP